jgi:hypothetical protein
MCELLCRGIESPLAIETDGAKMSTHKTVEIDDIEALAETERDENGRRIMVESGKVRQELAILDGKPAVVETPILVEKTRELTKQEKAEKLEDASRAMDDLAEKEFDPRQIG